MNYLIVIPQITKIKEQYYPFPIGIAYVSSSLKATGRSVSTLNLNYKEDSIPHLLKKSITDNNIDIVAVGGLTSQYAQIKDILDSVRAIKSDIITCVGGGIITSDPIPAMEALEVADYGLIGEGEITICELAEALEGKKPLNAVDGIIYREANKWNITNPREEIMDLDSIPFPDFEGFEFGDVLSKIPTDIYAFAGGHFATVCFGRSCPFNCTFCFHSSGSKYRQRSLDSIFGELDFLLTKYPIKNLAITDELFARNIQYVEEFCTRIRNYNLGFVVSLRVDIVTKEMLTLLKESGCLSITFGLESADNRILKSMRKHITVEQIENALTLANEVGINANGNFIFGDLEETFETATNTLDWRESHPQFKISLNWISVYPGSHLYKVACEKGIIKDKVQYIKDGCPLINISKLNDEEYREIAKRIDSYIPKDSHVLHNAKIIPKGFGKIDLIGNCPYCEKSNCFTNLDVFKPLSYTICTDCNQALNLLASDYIDEFFELNCQRLVAEKKIAIWPMVNSVPIMLSKSLSLNSSNVFIVDSSKPKQGGDCVGKKISAPSIIAAEQIEVVVITVTSSVSADIIDTIKKDYPSVKSIFFSGELILEQFDINNFNVY